VGCAHGTRGAGGDGKFLHTGDVTYAVEGPINAGRESSFEKLCLLIWCSGSDKFCLLYMLDD
jgi:hypothetical protein